MRPTRFRSKLERVWFEVWQFVPVSFTSQESVAMKMWETTGKSAGTMHKFEISYKWRMLWINFCQEPTRRAFCFARGLELPRNARTAYALINFLPTVTRKSITSQLLLTRKYEWAKRTHNECRTHACASVSSDSFWSRFQELLNLSYNLILRVYKTFSIQNFHFKRHVRTFSTVPPKQNFKFHHHCWLSCRKPI